MAAATDRPLTVPLPFSSVRPSRRQPCWSCCMSCTTSWPSKQVSTTRHRSAPGQSGQDSPALPRPSFPPATPAHRATPWGHAVQAWTSLFPRGSRSTHGPLGRYETLSRHVLGPCVGWKGPGLGSPLDPRHWSRVSLLFVGRARVVCGQPGVELLCSTLVLSSCPPFHLPNLDLADAIKGLGKARAEVQRLIGNVSYTPLSL